jgi:hypothetical protein
MQAKFRVRGKPPAPRGSTSRAERALSRVITEYFWVYASSGIFRDHEGGPAAWGRRGPAGSGCETAPGELASRRSRPPGKSGSWGSTQGSQRPRGVRARGVSAREESVPGSQRPGEPVPGEPVPGEPVPGEPVPGEPVPGEPVPGEGEYPGGHSGVGIRGRSKSPRAALVRFTQPRPTAAPQRFTPRRAQPLRENGGRATRGPVGRTGQPGGSVSAEYSPVAVLRHVSRSSDDADPRLTDDSHCAATPRQCVRRDSG